MIPKVDIKMAKNIIITEEQFKRIFKEIDEHGIDIDKDNMTVKFNPNHEENVDTSVENNPNYNNLGQLQFVSLFQRKYNQYGTDGNPLIYSLKNEKGWGINNDEKIKIINQIEQIVRKFLSNHNVSVIILMPSGSNINRMIGEIVSKECGGIPILENALEKFTVDEIDKMVTAPNSFFRTKTKDKYTEYYTKLKNCFNEMIEKRNGLFSRHFLTSDLRKIIKITMKLNSEDFNKNSRIIDNQNVLIIDDIVSKGQSLKEAFNILKNNFNPNSITLLSLMSNLKR